MRHALTITVLMVLLLVAACGGDDTTDTAAAGGDTATDQTSSDGGSSGGAVIDQQPPGQAKVTVDGREFTLTDQGGLDCRVEDEEFSFSFIIGDNDVVAGGGAVRNNDGTWMANPTLSIAEPDGEPGPINYFYPDIMAVDVAIDGTSVSMSGAMQKQPANDGSNPPPVDVGEGVFTFTCP